MEVWVMACVLNVKDTAPILCRYPHNHGSQECGPSAVHSHLHRLSFSGIPQAGTQRATLGTYKHENYPGMLTYTQAQGPSSHCKILLPGFSNSFHSARKKCSRLYKPGTQS